MPIDVIGHPASVLPSDPMIVNVVRANWAWSPFDSRSSYHQPTTRPSGARVKSAVLGSAVGQPALGCPSGPKAWIERTPSPASVHRSEVDGAVWSDYDASGYPVALIGHPSKVAPLTSTALTSTCSSSICTRCRRPHRCRRRSSRASTRREGTPATRAAPAPPRRRDGLVRGPVIDAGPVRDAIQPGDPTRRSSGKVTDLARPYGGHRRDRRRFGRGGRARGRCMDPSGLGVAAAGRSECSRTRRGQPRGEGTRHGASRSSVAAAGAAGRAADKTGRAGTGGGPVVPDQSSRRAPAGERRSS